MNSLHRFFYDFLVSKNISSQLAEYLNTTLLVLLLFVGIYVLNIILRRIVFRIFKKFALQSKNNLDDYLIANKTLDYLSNLVPLAVVLAVLPQIFRSFPAASHFIEIVLDLGLVLLILLIVRSVLRSIRDVLAGLDAFMDKPLESYLQVFMIFIWTIGGIFIFSLLTGKSIWSFLTALGAMSAVILLIFKDTILGFVASIQVAVNDTVRIGDWITMPKYGADGDVVEINLSSVKVQNFDKSITTIPTYYLTSESFKNWRGMLDAGGRRIKRSLYIKASSVRFLDEISYQKLEKIALIHQNLTTKHEEIEKHNSEYEIDKEILINGRNLSNLGVFRNYVLIYLKNRPDIHPEMVLMSRQLAPTVYGIPIEIYAFSKDNNWENYENTMADIFDHLLSAVSYFDLEVFELATQLPGDC